MYRALFCLLAACLAAAPAALRADDEDTLRPRAPVTILQINDVYSVLPVDGGKRGGLARVATLKKQVAAPGKTVLMTLGGDFLSPSVASSVFKGEQMVAALNAAGLDVATLGNHEFDFGPDVLRQRMAQARWQWVVSNVLDAASGKPVGGAAPYLVRQYGPLKIGFVGLVLSGSETSPDRLTGLRIEDPFAAAQRYLPVLKKQGADVIIALTHLDYADDRRMAQRYPQIDIILGGHDHFPVTTVVGRTLIVKAGSDARNVGRIDLDRANPKAAVERHFELVPITPELPDDPETARVAAEYEARLGRELDVAVGTTRVPLDARESTVRMRESDAGNLVADAMRAEVGADVALLNGGSLRGDRIFPAGPLTRRDLLAMHPFGSVVTKVEVTGAVLLEALSHGVARLEEQLGRFPQVSGMAFGVDMAAPAANRVRDVRVGGQPLDPQRRYTVAILDYLLEGGDGYAMFPKSKVLVDPEHGNLLVSALETYLRARGEVAPRVEGRIRISGAAAPGAAAIPARLPVRLATAGASLR